MNSQPPAANPQLSVYCDGGARGNPGPAASAFVVLDSAGQLVHEQGFFLGTATNNQAEYQAVLEALRWLASYQPAQDHHLIVNFYLDSQLVVNQINGFWKIKDSILRQKVSEVKKLIENCKLEIVNFVYIPRIRNSRADLLVNVTLDKHLSA